MVANGYVTESFVIACSDESTALTTGTAKVTCRAPCAMTVTAVRASLATASSSGVPTVDINEGGTTILSTKLTIDASEKTSTTAATAAVISDTAIATSGDYRHWRERDGTVYSHTMDPRSGMPLISRSVPCMRR